ncbi:RPA1C, partial [Symbiodinium natans]
MQMQHGTIQLLLEGHEWINQRPVLQVLKKHPSFTTGTGTLYTLADADGTIDANVTASANAAGLGDAVELLAWDAQRCQDSTMLHVQNWVVRAASGAPGTGPEDLRRAPTPLRHPQPTSFAVDASHGPGPGPGPGPGQFAENPYSRQFGQDGRQFGQDSYYVSLSQDPEREATERRNSPAEPLAQREPEAPRSGHHGTTASTYSWQPSSVPQGARTQCPPEAMAGQTDQSNLQVPQHSLHSFSDPQSWQSGSPCRANRGSAQQLAGEPGLPPAHWPSDQAAPQMQNQQQTWPQHGALQFEAPWGAPPGGPRHGPGAHGTQQSAPHAPHSISQAAQAVRPGTPTGVQQHSMLENSPSRVAPAIGGAGLPPAHWTSDQAAPQMQNQQQTWPQHGALQFEAPWGAPPGGPRHGPGAHGTQQSAPHAPHAPQSISQAAQAVRPGTPTGVQQHSMLNNSPSRVAPATGAVNYDGAPPSSTRFSTQADRNKSSWTINGLSSYKGTNWRLLARVTKKTLKRKFKKPEREGQLFNVDLMDKEGTETRATFFNQAADKFFDVLQDGQMFVFSGGRVKSGDKRFHSFDVEITFDEKAAIEPEVDTGEVPKLAIEPLESLACLESQEEKALVDLVAVIVEAPAPFEFTRKDSSQSRRQNLTLLDDSGVSCNLTLWEEFCSPDWQVGSVLLIKRAAVSNFGGKSLNSKAASQFLQGDQAFGIHQRAEQLSRWYQEHGAAALATARPLSESRRPAMLQTIEEMKADAVSLESPGADLGPEGRAEGGRPLQKYHTLSPVTVSAIPHEKPSFYMACAEEVPDDKREGRMRACNKKMEPAGNSWTCTAGHSCQEPTARWICYFSVSDHTGTQSMSSFDDVGQVLMGCK